MPRLKQFPTPSGWHCVADRFGTVRRALAATPAPLAIAAAIAAALALAQSGAKGQIVSTPAVAGDALTRYRAALDRLKPLGNIVFMYVESRSGPTRALEEEHRVYRRADGEERNETTAVNGAQVVPAIVRYSSKPVWPYDVHSFVVDTSEYNVVRLSNAVVGGKRALAFSTVRTTTGDFSVTGLYLDPLRYLPVRETFAVTGGGCTGTGTIDFAPVGGRWLPASVSVSCSVTQDEASFKEKITFSDYTFVQTLPPDVFGGR